MRFSLLAPTFLLGAAQAASDQETFQALANNASAIEAARLASGTGACTKDNIVVRKPWYVYPHLCHCAIIGDIPRTVDDSSLSVRVSH